MRDFRGRKLAAGATAFQLFGVKPREAAAIGVIQLKSAVRQQQGALV